MGNLTYDELADRIAFVKLNIIEGNWGVSGFHCPSGVHTRLFGVSGVLAQTHQTYYLSNGTGGFGRDSNLKIHPRE